MQQTSVSTQEIIYYKKTYIQHLLREGCCNREMAFLGNNAPVRALSCQSLYDLERALNWVGWEKHRQNMYRTVAKVKEIPKFTFNPKLRSAETGKWFENNFDNLVYEYDLFLDWDGKPEDLPEILEEIKKFKGYLDSYQVPYYIQFSGKKGFHLYIDGKYMPKFKIENGVVQPHKKIGEFIKEGFKLKYLDLRNTGIPNRLCKVPYSLVGDNVVLPLSDLQIEKFSINMVNLEIVMNEIPLIRRGTLERFPELSLEQKKKNVQEFINSITFK